jgi:hypothetical protein
VQAPRKVRSVLTFSFLHSHQIRRDLFYFGHQILDDNEAPFTSHHDVIRKMEGASSVWVGDESPGLEMFLGATNTAVHGAYGITTNALYVRGVHS